MTINSPRKLTLTCGEGIASTIRFGEDKANEIYYKSSMGPLVIDGNVWLAATLVPSMKLGSSLCLESPVSPRLNNSVSVIQDIFCSWYSDFRRVPVELDSKPDSEGYIGTRGVGCFFTGGVDSFYTLIKHQKEITTLVFVHGFNYSLSNLELRQKVSGMIHKVAKIFNKDFIEVETNLRDFGDEYSSWPRHFHGAALASIALLLSKLIRKIYIPATHTYAHLFPCGSHPLLDPLWSTENMEIVHDGCEATRVEKIRKIAPCDIAMSSLRVCWKNYGGAYNCARCEKCLRTMIELRIAGALERCTTFDSELDLEKVRRMKLDSYKRSFFENDLSELAQSGKELELAQAMRDCIEGFYYGGVSSWPRRALRKLLPMQHSSSTSNYVPI